MEAGDSEALILVSLGEDEDVEGSIASVETHLAASMHRTELAIG